MYTRTGLHAKIRIGYRIFNRWAQTKKTNKKKNRKEKKSAHLQWIQFWPQNPPFDFPDFTSRLHRGSLLCSEEHRWIYRQFQSDREHSCEGEQRKKRPRWRLTGKMSTMKFKKKGRGERTRIFLLHWLLRMVGAQGVAPWLRDATDWRLFHLFHGWIVWQVTGEWYDWLPLCKTKQLRRGAEKPPLWNARRLK